jgi:arsenate reductase
MAEGWTRALRSEEIEAHSAGVAPHGMDQRAIAAMADAGVDISGHESKHVDSLAHLDFDYVITVCDHASERCPVYPGGTKVIHRGFDDPPRLAREADSEDSIRAAYHRVRDEIRAFVESLPKSLEAS